MHLKHAILTDCISSVSIHANDSDILILAIAFYHELNTGFIQCPQGPAYPGVCPLIEVFVRFSDSLSARRPRVRDFCPL